MFGSRVTRVAQGTAGAAVVLLVAGGVAATASAQASKHATARDSVLAEHAFAHRPSEQVVKNGYYAGLANVESADIEFHIRKGTQSKDLALECTQTDDFGNDDFIAVHAPKLTIKHGVLSYDGPADVSGPSFGDPVTGTSTLKLHLKHVNGPVLHYTHEGEHHSETTAWKGNVSSPACSSVGDHGKATLFGPVPGE